MQRGDRLLVVVSGAPGSGKTTLARPLAEELALPLIRKDAIKEALGDAIGAPDYESSRRLGAITMQVLRALMRDVGFGVYESTWREQFDRDDVGRLPGPLVEVFCACDPTVRRERVRGRIGTRHPVHFDLEHAAAAGDDDATGRPLAGPWPLIRVDTTRPVDIPAVAERVTRAARVLRR